MSQQAYHSNTNTLPSTSSSSSSSSTTLSTPPNPQKYTQPPLPRKHTPLPRTRTPPGLHILPKLPPVNAPLQIKNWRNDIITGWEERQMRLDQMKAVQPNIRTQRNMARDEEKVKREKERVKGKVAEKEKKKDDEGEEEKLKTQAEILKALHKSCPMKGCIHTDDNP
ncbi:hypothetical protein HYALB_00005514 [Hymenoscyphus albidus]|uniref:Uncharacterized protein n=1 Tax=Hymenoscyphus albidus TaxID=595503 RepID=A0A9N9M3A6_9HELO|nr:hypothetical protein HYALB_00005514 [Hymenoscyphus albidus]